MCNECKIRIEAIAPHLVKFNDLMIAPNLTDHDRFNQLCLILTRIKAILNPNSEEDKKEASMLTAITNLANTGTRLLGKMADNYVYRK